MAGISSKAATTLANKFKYNGKEEQRREFSDGSGLEWLDYGARMYDPQIGRWGLIDPHSQNYSSFTPYVYVGNNPTFLIDPDGRDWFYHSANGSSDPTWIWHDGDSYNTGVKDDEGNDVVLQGTEAVVVFNGSRGEKLGTKDGKPGYIDGEGAITASVTVYGPDGSDDVHRYSGYTMGSNPEKFGAIDEGIYDGNYDAAGKSGALKSNWAVNNRGRVRMMDGMENPYRPGQKDEDGDGYKTGIFIHSSNRNGYAGEIHNGQSAITVGCLLITPDDWKSFNEVMEGVQNFKVQIIRQITERVPLQGRTGQVPGVFKLKKNTKKE